MATKLSSANLAVRHRSTRTEPRIALRRLRVAFVGIVSNAKRMPDCFYSLTRERERAFPFEREREYVHRAIREGATTPEQIVDWRLAQLRDDLEQFDASPELSELVYVQLITEQAEAIDAQSRAHAMPTASNRELAIRETVQAMGLQQMFVRLLARGERLLHAAH